MKNNFLNKPELMEESIKIKEFFQGNKHEIKKKTTSDPKTFNRTQLVNETYDKSLNIKFGFLIKFKSIFSRKKFRLSEKKKLEAYGFLNNYFDKRLDLISYFKYMNSIDKLRFVILDKQQNHC